MVISPVSSSTSAAITKVNPSTRKV
jgi:hypothetical protein